MQQPAALPDPIAELAARQRQTQLTKPPGALGTLESLAIRFASFQGTATPRLDRVHIAVFAADHGIAASGVSAYPQSVTAAMVRNFVAGGAAISVLARELGATLEVIDVGTLGDPPGAGVIDARIAPGTRDFTTGPAMSDDELTRALRTGVDSAERAHAANAQLYIGGDMGIGNTTAATAIIAALLSLAPSTVTGPGTGLDAAGVVRKARIIQQALWLHQSYCATPIETLRRLGGFEIAALTGAMTRAAQLGLPVLVDGFITSTAALVAVRVEPAVADWLLYSHRSAEPGHATLLQALGATPLLDLGMRLGEGSGAAVAVPLLRLACAIHAGMATFAEAGIAGPAFS